MLWHCTCYQSCYTHCHCEYHKSQQLDPSSQNIDSLELISAGNSEQVIPIFPRQDLLKHAALKDIQYVFDTTVNTYLRIIDKAIDETTLCCTDYTKLCQRLLKHTEKEKIDTQMHDLALDVTKKINAALENPQDELAKKIQNHLQTCAQRMATDYNNFKERVLFSVVTNNPAILQKTIKGIELTNEDYDYIIKLRGAIDKIFTQNH